uniref:Roadblock/LAMTOR2 domain-containing protein n=1 Tax=Fibrocapsa japonica TaxID=94617 RepID=A0A7S2XUU9_9STRA|mmetsp:Transcript_1131/g.1535  ORF Transcript_1131/g.1535 Transcript_1131/m.1535 type:complete len:121 (+) Transcript_1131:193-555(+)|eukprot:CAMPEP_0113941104 /NCGR_PEP_ID=MMETSP1339-20121228/7102_1 /TAXON_ID=94617 /ORGANISM="Fibrocapsa japonica" /LENGTH=120 /DNA_ID=CAMNT_0000945161 /DNA_START=159 /DNA_END=521 /DNA_ORIENTATION=- /assembly_acc=CAM_ASM_000762
MASQQPNEVEEVIRELKKNPGFDAYVIMNNDGIVIKYENMEYKTAVHHAHLVLDLCTKSKKYIRELFEPPDNEVESLRLRTADYEMIIAQHGNFTLTVLQKSQKAMSKKETVVEEKKEEA